jgi:hypothetical protein
MIPNTSGSVASKAGSVAAPAAKLPVSKVYRTCAKKVKQVLAVESYSLSYLKLCVSEEY